MPIQTITLTTTGSSSQIEFFDLDGLTVTHPATVELQTMFQPTALTASYSLQMALDMGQITLTNNSGQVTSVSELLSNSSSDTWVLDTGRNITNNSAYYYSDVDSIVMDRSAYRIDKNCTITNISCSNTSSGPQWIVGIEKSTTGEGGPYTIIWSQIVITSGVFGLDNTLYNLNVGDYIRVYQDVIAGQTAPERPRVELRFKSI